MDENCALLGYYAACSGIPLPAFRDNISVPSSRVKNSLENGPIGCAETSIRNYHYTPRNNPEGCSSQSERSLSLHCSSEMTGDLHVNWSESIILKMVLKMCLYDISITRLLKGAKVFRHNH